MRECWDDYGESSEGERLKRRCFSSSGWEKSTVLKIFKELWRSCSMLFESETARYWQRQQHRAFNQGNSHAIIGNSSLERYQRSFP
jgi:hypothetical protein